MNDLIKVTYNAGEPTVSARELHVGLEIKSNFTTWFDRMCEYGFTELVTKVLSKFGKRLPMAVRTWSIMKSLLVWQNADLHDPAQ